jgi:hypothetical protein
MFRLRRFTLAAAALVALPALGQFKTPVPIVSPTPAPGSQRKELPNHGPKELPPTRTPVPTRTPTPTPVPPVVRQFDVRPGEIVVKKQSAPSGCSTKVETPSPTQTFVQIHCPLTPPTGLKADFEFWKGLRLRNGWKVSSLKAEWSGASNPQPPDNNHTGFRVSTAPAVDSDNPETTLHLFATPGLTINVEVVLTVKGPAGTSPR